MVMAKQKMGLYCNLFNTANGELLPHLDFSLWLHSPASFKLLSSFHLTPKLNFPFVAEGFYQKINEIHNIRTKANGIWAFHYPHPFAGIDKHPVQSPNFQSDIFLFYFIYFYFFFIFKKRKTMHYTRI